MNTTKLKSIRNATVYVLILFAVCAALFGSVKQIPEEEPFDKPKNPEITEVFSQIPQTNVESVFLSFQAPLSGSITSGYGFRTDPFTGESSYHNGVDIAAKEGTEVRAAQTGTVTASAYDNVGGHYVILTHENGSKSYYGHLQTRTVARGDQVNQGQIIGLSGKTGKVTGPHLHFQLTYQGRTVDPARHIRILP